LFERLLTTLVAVSATIFDGVSATIFDGGRAIRQKQDEL